MARAIDSLEPFAITAALCVAGIVVWVFVVGNVELITWLLAQRRPTKTSQ